MTLSALGLYVAISWLSAADGSSYKAVLVTCGSAVKLKNTEFGAVLHSEDATYSSGSEQQIVIGVKQGNNADSHWLVKGEHLKGCPRGRPIECGDVIRLEHLTTAKNLHSHDFRSPLSEAQEVSAFGEHGRGDRGDSWQLLCQSDFWRRDAPVVLRHLDTAAYLAVSGNQYSEGGLEVVGIGYLLSTAYWKVDQGLYIHPSTPVADPKHMEL